jgi:hypothetical protein
MALVKAQMSFYHDSVGTRAKDEVFEIQNDGLVSSLEQAGYVTRVDGQTQQAFDSAKSLEQQVGQRNALTNEAVSLAGHEHNQQAAQHQQQFAQMRQQAGQAAVEQEISRLEQSGETKRAEQLRSGLESQRQAQQEQQQVQNQYNSNNAQMRQAEKAAQENAALSQTQATNTTQAEAEQAAANTATSAQAQGRAKKADR